MPLRPPGWGDGSGGGEGGKYVTSSAAIRVDGFITECPQTAKRNTSLQEQARQEQKRIL